MVDISIDVGGLASRTTQVYVSLLGEDGSLIGRESADEVRGLLAWVASFPRLRAGTRYYGTFEAYEDDQLLLSGRSSLWTAPEAYQDDCGE